MSVTDRLVDFEACFNFRDLGGYRSVDGRLVRSGQLFRSDTLHRLSAKDLEVFAGLGLQAVIDLRTATELNDHGSLAAEGRNGIVWHHVPLFDGVMRLEAGATQQVLAEAAEREPSSPGATYLAMTGDGRGVARAFELLTAPGALPAVFHCTSGKDRTGMVAAMILDLLGVPDDVIANDYELTNTTRERSMRWIAENEPGFAAFLAQIPPERRVTRAETILGFLEGIRDSHGSVEAFLVAGGVGTDRLTGFREALLHEAPEV